MGRCRRLIVVDKGELELVITVEMACVEDGVGEMGGEEGMMLGIDKDEERGGETAGEGGHGGHGGHGEYIGYGALALQLKGVGVAREGEPLAGS